jgi:hypothetical protein
MLTNALQVREQFNTAVSSMHFGKIGHSFNSMFISPFNFHTASPPPPPRPHDQHTSCQCWKSHMLEGYFHTHIKTELDILRA